MNKTYGGDKEADETLDKLARALSPREGLELGTDAKVYIDVTGALCIYTRIGLLKIDSDNLDLVHSM